MTRRREDLQDYEGPVPLQDCQEPVPTPYELLVAKTRCEELHRALGTLTPMEARILRWHFGLDGVELTFKEIGDKYDLSPGYIGLIRRRALRRLKNQLDWAWRSERAQEPAAKRFRLPDGDTVIFDDWLHWPVFS